MLNLSSLSEPATQLQNSPHPICLKKSSVSLRSDWTQPWWAFLLIYVLGSVGYLKHQRICGGVKGRTRLVITLEITSYTFFTFIKFSKKNCQITKTYLCLWTWVSLVEICLVVQGNDERHFICLLCIYCCCSGVIWWFEMVIKWANKETIASFTLWLMICWPEAAFFASTHLCWHHSGPHKWPSSP